MKQLVKHIIYFVPFGLFMFSCSLDEEPPYENAEEYYQTEAQCISGLNACYIPMRSIFTASYMQVTETATDMLYCQASSIDAKLELSPASPGFGSTIWTQAYKGVMYCNSIIAAIRRAPLEDDVRLPLLAEGMIIRAYYYYVLTCTFGDVPFYTEDVKDIETQKRVASLGRMSAADTRDYLIEELQEYVPSMQQKRTYDIADNRIGASVGWIVLGKLAQWNHRWDDAREAMDHLEAIYGDLQQYPLEDIAFRNKNTPESILEIQFTYSATGLKITHSVAAMTMPPRSEGYVYDGVSIPELGDQSNQYTSMRPTSNYLTGCRMMERESDKRIKLNLAWEYNGNRFASVTSRPWMGPKFWSYNMYNVSDGNNLPVFRYADAVLMQAENYMELSETGNSVKYLNYVRQRAGIADYVFKNIDLLREEIRKERARELIGEFQRKYDLVRWGIWYESVTGLEENVNMRNNAIGYPCRQYHPIPDREVVNSGGNLDNNEYKKYGL